MLGVKFERLILDYFHGEGQTHGRPRKLIQG